MTMPLCLLGFLPNLLDLISSLLQNLSYSWFLTRTIDILPLPAPK